MRMRLFTLSLVLFFSVSAFAQSDVEKMNFQGAYLSDLLRVYSEYGGVSFKMDTAVVDKLTAKITDQAYIALPAYPSTRVEDQDAHEKALRPIVKSVLGNMGLFGYFEKTTLLIYSKDKCRSEVPDCAKLLVAKEQELAELQASLIPPAPPVRFSSWTGIANKNVCTTAILPLSVYRQRYGIGRVSARLSSFGSVHSGALSVYSGSDPYRDFGLVASEEVKKQLFQSVKANPADKNCDHEIRGYYATADEIVEGGGFDGRKASRQIADGRRAVCGLLGRGCNRTADRATRGAEVLVSTVGKEKQERSATIVLYLEVVHKASGQIVWMKDGAGSIDLTEFNRTEILAFEKHQIAYNNAQPLARRAAASAFSSDSENNTTVQRINAEDVENTETERNKKKEIDARTAKKKGR